MRRAPLLDPTPLLRQYTAFTKIMRKAVLIFPAGMPRALSFLSKCLNEGTTVVGASSLANDPVREQYPEWSSLPYVFDAEFGARLSQVIAAHGIGSIYTPHPVVWNYLNQNLPSISPGTSLLNSSPAVTELEAHRAAVSRAHHALDNALELSNLLPARCDLSVSELAALYRHSEDIPGMCDHEKIRALYEVFRHCPQGDVVEIGTWWGKSAFVLLWLARRFGIGSLLCVDPWSDAHLVQNDDGALVDTLSAQFSAEEAFQVFQVNLIPYASGDVNYLRLPSMEAAQRYSSDHAITSPAFGDTSYCGKIALLHIDGNHSHDSVLGDLFAWKDFVISGGWIVMDDYTWPFGDGPKRVGNEFLHAHRDGINSSFVMGGALFIQLR